MTTIQNSKYFQHHMKIETDKVLNGSRTPFKDTLTHAFETTSNTLAILSNTTAVGRIQSRSWLLEACAEANQEAIQHDKVLAESSLFAKLQAQELENAIRAQGGIA
jgi:hypothetical protein